MAKARFEAELFEGHKGVTAVLVPFDPAEKWARPPLRLDRRRHGWLVTGTADGVRFDGWIGERWNRFFLIIDDELRAAAQVSVGDVLSIAIEPTATARALAIARAQAKRTTAPKKPRADAVDPPGEISKR